MSRGWSVVATARTIKATEDPRRLASSWPRSGWLAERSSRTSSSGRKPDHSI